MPFANRLGSDFQGLYPQSAGAGAAVFPGKQLRSPDRSQRQRLQAGLSAHRGRHHPGIGRRPVGATCRWTCACNIHGVGRDWPISYEELEPYYLQAENEMGVAGPNDPAQQSPVERSGPYPMDMVPWAYGDQRFADVVNPHGYRSVPIPQGRSTRLPGAAVPPVAATTIVSLSVRSAPCTTASIMSRRPRRRAPSLPQAVVYKIDTDENNRVTAVHWYDPARKSHKATGRHFAGLQRAGNPAPAAHGRQ